MRDGVTKTAEVSTGDRDRALRVLARFAVMAAVAYVISYEPIVPLFPVCWEAGLEGPVRHTLYDTVTDEFTQALRFHQYPEHRRHVGGVILMPVREWMFGFWYPSRITTAAVWRIVSERHGLDRDEVFRRSVRLPGLKGTGPPVGRCGRSYWKAASGGVRGRHRSGTKRRACRVRRASSMPRCQL